MWNELFDMLDFIASLREDGITVTFREQPAPRRTWWQRLFRITPQPGAPR